MMTSQMLDGYINPDENVERWEDLTVHTSVDCVARLFQTLGHAPKGWFRWANVRKAFIRLFREARQNIPDKPDWPGGDGIILVAGGWRYFPGAYVTIRMIRHFGCDLPIQVWYLGDDGEYDQRMGDVTRDYDVTWINADQFARTTPGVLNRIVGPWELKALAMYHSPFKRVVYMDADCYPALNVASILDHPSMESGAMFWPDLPNMKMRPGWWSGFGLPYYDEPAFEAGQIVLDKEKCHRALWLSHWLNSFSDYVFHYIYGDKDTFHVAFRATSTDFTWATPKANWVRVAFLHHWPGGNLAFIHRVRDKFRWRNDPDGNSLELPWMTPQNTGRCTSFCRPLPQEKLVHQFFQELQESIVPSTRFIFRKDTWDAGIWNAVTSGNEYKLDQRFGASDVIIDIGAHIGAFAHTCLRRGAGKVVCYEPHPDNFELLKYNLSDYSNRIQFNQAAVVGKLHSKLQVGQTTYAFEDRQAVLRGSFCPENTGGYSLIYDQPNQQLEHTTSVVPIDEILSAHPTVRLLKMDCEGMEYDILEHADLSGVQEIVGEAHDIGRTLLPIQIPEILSRKGFSVRMMPQGGSSRLSLFQALRPADASWSTVPSY